MARIAQRLKVEYSKDALQNLERIWSWNMKHQGATKATLYVKFLRSRIGYLATQDAPGKIVEANPKYRYYTIKQRSNGYGHVAIFELKGDTLRVLRIYHSAQNWEDDLGSAE